jgi:hypothetical protein
VVRSSLWNNTGATYAGAVTWGNGTTGVSGNVTATNSLVGTTANDQVGSGGVTALTNGNYVVISTLWDNTSATNAGAVTWGNGTTGVSGNVTSTNSIVGNSTNANSGMYIAYNSNQDALYVTFPNDGSGRVVAGSQASGFAPISDSLNSGGGAIILQASQMTIQSSVNTTTANSIQITANSLNISGNGSVNATASGSINIRTFGGGVDLGGAGDSANLGLSQTELNQITANLLTIGNISGGNISFNQNISWPSNITLSSNKATSGVLSNSSHTFTQGIYTLNATGIISVVSATIDYSILISSNSPVIYGSSVLLTASITHSGAAFNSGTISFYNNGLLLGIGNISSDMANYTWSGAGAGSYSNITATGNVTGALSNGSNTANVTVTPYGLSVTANTQSKVYGASVPSLTYTNATLVNGDTASVFTGNLATTGTANSGVGNYSITQGNLSAGSNYAISYTSANLAVTPYSISVTANNQTKAYGEAVPTLTFTNSPLVNGDSSSVFTGALATTATANSPGGYYPIIIGTLSVNPNYTIASFTNGTLSESEALRTVVTTPTDTTDPYDDLVSLREAIDYGTTLTGNQSITFATGIYSSNVAVITLTQGVLTINDISGEIRIVGPLAGSGKRLTVSGNNTSGIFKVLSPAGISNITLSNGIGGHGTSPNIQGGAIYSNSTITLDYLTIANSTANFGGAIYQDGGSLTLNSSHVTDSIYVSNSGNIAISDTQSISLSQINACSLTVNSTGGTIAQHAGSNITVSGTARFHAIGNLNLSNSTNDFGTVLATGTDVTINDINALVLGTITANNLTVGAGGAITQTGVANVTATANFTSTGSGDNGNITLDQSNLFATVLASGTNVKIKDINAMVLGTITANYLTVEAGGDISQTGAANVSTGTANFVTTGNIALNNATNNFWTVTADGRNITVNDSNNITIGAITASGDFTVQGDNTTSCISVTGPIDATGGLGNVRLTGRNIVVTGNISTAVGGISLIGNNGTFQTGSFDGVCISGSAVNVNTTSGNISIDGRGGLNTACAGVNLASSKVQAGVSGCVTIKGMSGNGSAGNAYGINVDGATIGTNSGSIMVNGTSCGTGADSRGVYLKSSASISATGAGNVTITGSTPGNNTGLGIQSINAGDSVYSNGGLIALTANSLELTGAVNATVAGHVVIQTLGSGVNLGGTGNSTTLGLTNTEIGLITAQKLTIGSSTTGNITITDGIRFGNLTISSGGSIRQNGGNLTVPGAASFMTTGNAIVLNNATNNFYSTGSISASGGNTTILNSNATVLGQISVTELTVNSTGGNITQAAGSNIVVSNNGTFISNNTINLSNQTNSIGNLSVTSATAEVEVTGNQAVGSLNVANLVFTGTGSLTQDPGTSLVVTGTANFSVTGNITFNDPNNNFSGPIIVSGNTISIYNSGPSNLTSVDVEELILTSATGDIIGSTNIFVRGANTTYLTAVNGNIIMTNLTNDFVGGIYANASNIIEIYNSNLTILGNISATSFNMTSAGGNITQILGTDVRVTDTSNFVATGNAIILSEPTNNFGTLTANGTDITIVDAGTVDLGLITANSLTVIAGGAISQSAGANVTTESNFTASGNTITLNQASNDLGNVTSNGILTISSGNLTTLNVVGGTANISGGTISGTTTTSVNLNQTNGTINGLIVNGNISNLSGGMFTGNANVTTGTLISSINLGSLTVGVSGTANLTGGSVTTGNVTSAGALITAINLGNVTVSAGSVKVTTGTTNITAGSGTSANVTGGTLISAASLTSLTIGAAGTANISAGTIGATTNDGNLNGSGGTFASIASSNSTNLTGGTVAVTGLSNVTAGTFAANATLGNMTVATGAIANLTAGSANVTDVTGRLFSAANMNSLNVLTSGVANISGGVVNAVSSVATLNVTGGNITSLAVTGGTSNISGGQVDGLANVTGGNLLSNRTIGSLTVGAAGTANITGGSVGTTINAGNLTASAGTFSSITSSNSTTLTGGTATVTGLSNVTGGTFTANAILGDLAISLGTANLTGGTVANLTQSAGTVTSVANITGFANISGGIATINNGGIVGGTTTVSGSGNLTANASLGVLSITAGTANLTGGSAGATTVNGTLNSRANLTSLDVQSAGTANITGGQVGATTSANILNVSAGNITSLAVTAGTTRISGGIVGATTTAATLNLTGGNITSLTVSAGTSNISGGQVDGLAKVTGGSLVANRTLGYVTVSGGTTNLTSGSVTTNLTQSAGTVTSVANITSFANLTGGNTTVNNGGIIGGTTTVSSTGNLTSNGSLREGLQLTAGTATFVGGNVTRTGDNSAIAANGGTLKAHNTTITGSNSANGNTPVVYISGGTVDLGNSTANGCNTLTVGNCGTFYLLFNNATANVSAIGNTWNGVNTTTANLSQLYDTVDRIIDSVDVGSLGLVRIKANNVYVTIDSFYSPLGTTAADVQRGVEIATVGDTVNVEAGDYNVTNNANNGVVSVSKNLTISGDGVVATSIRAFVLNNGANITTWGNISATSNLTIHSGAVINNATATPTLVSLIDSNGSLIFDSGATYQAQLNVVNKNLTITSNTPAPASAATINTIGSGSANTAISLSGTGNITLTDLTLGGSGSALNATNTGSLTINRLALNAGLANLTTGVKGTIANTGPFTFNGQTANSNYTFNSTGMSTSFFNSQFLSFSPSGNVTINSFAGNDNFTIDRIMLTTTINGGAGNDVFSLGTTSATSNTSSVTMINGEAGNNTLNGPLGRANVFTLTGNGNGTLNTSNVTGFTSMENLNGGTMSDTVFVARGAVFTSIIGGGGIDTIQVESNAGDTVNMTISGTNTGNITGTGGTSVGVYTGISHLIGTAGNDTFKFIDNASLLTGSINGGTGTNAINYTGTTKPTFVNLATGQATGLTTTTNTGVATNIQDLFGGTGADYFSGSSASNVMDGGTGNDTLLGLAGNDILVGNYGQDLINGGSGYDILIGGYINFATGMLNATLQEGLQMIMTSWIGVTTNELFTSVSNTLNTASSSQYRLVGDTNLASTYLLQTVFNDQATDTLIDIASASVPNWFFATERVSQGNDVVQAGTTFTVSKKTVTSKSGRTAR